LKKGVRWHDKPVSKNMTGDFGGKMTEKALSVAATNNKSKYHFEILKYF